MGAANDIASSSSDFLSNSDTQVVLNIYDLIPLNQYTYWFGFGIFHSGIEGLSLPFILIWRFFLDLMISNTSSTVLGFTSS